MVEFLVTYRFESQEDRDGFYGEIKSKGIKRLCEDEEGCIRYDYFYPCDDEKVLFLLEQWETMEHQKVHTSQPHFGELGKLKDKYNCNTEVEINGFE